MERVDADRRRLEDLQRLCQRMTEVEMPKATAAEISQLSDRCITAALWADIIVDRITAWIPFRRGAAGQPGSSKRMPS